MRTLLLPACRTAASLILTLIRMSISPSPRKTMQDQHRPLVLLLASLQRKLFLVTLDQLRPTYTVPTMQDRLATASWNTDCNIEDLLTRTLLCRSRTLQSRICIRVLLDQIEIARQLRSIIASSEKAQLLTAVRQILKICRGFLVPLLLLGRQVRQI